MNTGILVDLNLRRIRVPKPLRCHRRLASAWRRSLIALARQRATGGVVAMTLEDVARIVPPEGLEREHAAIVADLVWRRLPEGDRAALARMAQTNADNTVLAMYDALWRALLQEPDIMLVNALWERARDETRQPPA